MECLNKCCARMELKERNRGRKRNGERGHRITRVWRRKAMSTWEKEVDDVEEKQGAKWVKVQKPSPKDPKIKDKNKSERSMGLDTRMTKSGQDERQM